MRARLVVFCGVAVSLLGQVAGNEDLYRLASKELVQPTGLKFEMNLKASLKDGLIKETWRGEGLFDGEMNALRSKKIHYHWAAVDQVDVEVMKSEFVGSVKAGERESPFEHQDDLQGKTFSFVQKAGVWSVAGGVKKPDAKLQKKKEDELFHFLQCFPVTASDQKLFGLNGSQAIRNDLQRICHRNSCALRTIVNCHNSCHGAKIAILTLNWFGKIPNQFASSIAIRKKVPGYADDSV